MKDGEVRLPKTKYREACAAFHAGICPVLTGRKIKNGCGYHYGCILRGATALVADDYRSALYLNTRILELMGLNVIACSDGASAYETVANKEITMDLAVLDVNMPGKNGFEVCRAIRENNKHIPVVFATGDESPDLETRLDELEANALITKPYTLEQIRRVTGGMLCPFMGQHLFGDS